LHGGYNTHIDMSRKNSEYNQAQKHGSLNIRHPAVFTQSRRINSPPSCFYILFCLAFYPSVVNASLFPHREGQTLSIADITASKLRLSGHSLCCLPPFIRC